MAVSAGKTKFAQDIYEETDCLIRKMKDNLPGTYADIIKAIVDAFNALPKGIKENLVSRNVETRNTVLKALEGFTPQPSTDMTEAFAASEARTEEVERRLAALEIAVSEAQMHESGVRQKIEKGLRSRSRASKTKKGVQSTNNRDAS